MDIRDDERSRSAEWLQLAQATLGARVRIPLKLSFGTFLIFISIIIICIQYLHKQDLYHCAIKLFIWKVFSFFFLFFYNLSLFFSNYFFLFFRSFFSIFFHEIFFSDYIFFQLKHTTINPQILFFFYSFVHIFFWFYLFNVMIFIF